MMQVQPPVVHKVHVELDQIQNGSLNNLLSTSEMQRRGLNDDQMNAILLCYENPSVIQYVHLFTDGEIAFGTNMDFC